MSTADRELAEMHSFMLVRHGQVVVEGWWAPYDAQTPHQLYSLSKSFTSTAAGLAIAEGKFRLDDRVLSFFPDDAPADPGEHLQAMRVRDLLTMATGHASEPQLAATAQAWTKTFLAHEVPHQPGTHFLYNTPATYMISAIVQQQTGQTVLDYLGPRFFAPLGIRDPFWGTSPQGITLGGYGLKVRTEDLARLGLLYLHKGKWGNEQILPEQWVEMATSKQVSNGDDPQSDWSQGYGFQFWRCRHGCFRGDGAFGQYCIVMPQQDAVVAITSGVKNMQAVLNVVWDKLLPAMGPEVLAEAPDACAELRRKLGTLLVPLPEGNRTSPMAESVSGRKYRFADNASQLQMIGIESGDEETDPTLILQTGGVVHRMICGRDKWVVAELAHPLGAALFPERAVAVAGSWSREDTLVVKICFRETPHCLTYQLKFAGDQLTLDTEMNVAFGPTRLPTLTGQAEELPANQTPQDGCPHD